MSENGNGRQYVTTAELKDKLNGLRWEMRFYMVVLILGVLLRFQVPQTTAAAVIHLFPH